MGRWQQKGDIKEFDEGTETGLLGYRETPGGAVSREEMLEYIRKVLIEDLQ